MNKELEVVASPRRKEKNFLTWDALIYFFLKKFRSVTTTKTLKGYSFVKGNCHCFNQKNYHNLDQICWFERNTWKNLIRWAEKSVLNGVVTPRNGQKSRVPLWLFHPYKGSYFTLLITRDGAHLEGPSWTDSTPGSATHQACPGNNNGSTPFVVLVVVSYL